jgi:diguanylate cyclase
MNQTATPPVPAHFLAALVTAIHHAQTLEALVRPLLELLQTATGMESSYLTRLDQSEGVLRVLYARNSQRLTVPEGLAIAWEGSLSKRALEEGRFYTEDVASCWADCEIASSLRLASHLSAPIRGQGGELLGSLCAASQERRPLPETASDVLALLAHLIGQAMEQERLRAAVQQAEQALSAMALTDPVTELPNRRAVLEEMQRRLDAQSDAAAVIVAVIDLDGFKPINDQYGPEIGDQFLQTVAKRLRRMLRDGDMAARIGGDEFVVLAAEQREKADEAAAALSRRLEAATQGRFKLDAGLVDYDGASVGAIVAQSDDAQAQGLLKRAEAAMAAVKQERKRNAAASAPAGRTVARFQWPSIE